MKDVADSYNARKMRMKVKDHFFGQFTITMQEGKLDAERFRGRNWAIGYV